MSRFRLSAACALGVAAVLAGPVAAQGLKVGEKAADYSFHGAVINGDGRTDLKEFRGNVILLDWWGNH